MKAAIKYLSCGVSFFNVKVADPNVELKKLRLMRQESHDRHTLREQKLDQSKEHGIDIRTKGGIA